MEPPLITARSARPSPLKSQGATPLGPDPPLENGDPGAGENLPCPSPSRTATLLDAWLATTRSAFPSSLKSSTAIASGRAPPLGEGEPGAGEKPPWPSPSRTATFALEAPEPSTSARSRLSSPLRSPETMAEME